MDSMRQELKDIILHASGLSQSCYSRRSSYCCKSDDPELLELVEMNLMSGPHYLAMLRDESAYFYLTDEGKAKAWELKLEALNHEAGIYD